MSWLDGITDSMDMFEQTPGDSEGQGRPGVLQARSVRSDHEVTKSQAPLPD